MSAFPGAVPCCGGEACVPLRPLGLCQLELMLLVGSTILTYIGLRERGQTKQRPGPSG